MRRIACFAGIAFSLIAATVANAGGGGDIASAPQLPIGQNVTGGGTCPGNCSTFLFGTYYGYVEFWRVLAVQADALTVDYGSLDGHNVVVCLLAPSVTDYTLQDAQCLARDDTSSKHELRFTFPAAGTYTLEIAAGDAGDSHTISYQLTADIKHYTHSTIAAPKLVKHGSRVTYTGLVTGVSAGRVELQSRSLAHPTWKTFGLATITTKGTFRYITKVTKPGTYRIKAVYPGDQSHQPSAAIVSFKVV